MASTTPTLDQHLSSAAIVRLGEQYNISNIEAAWLAGDYGTLCAQDTGKCVGMATIDQAIDSYEESEEGIILIGLLAVYVSP